MSRFQPAEFSAAKWTHGSLMIRKPSLPASPWRIAVDVGGTFTDMVLVDAGGRFHVFKTPSVPADPSRGVLDVLEHAAGSFGADVASLLSDCTLFLHGSTVATNTVLEGSGARVGMLVTRGFRDFLEARRGFRTDPFDHRPPYPPVLVPRYLRLPVGGRLDAHGAEVQPLDEANLDAAIDTFRVEAVESIAVCLLHSFENGAHERRCAEVLRERGGFEWVSLSHEVVPVIGEYERGSTTVVNACIGPKVVRYLRALDERLRALGLGPDLLVLQSNGRAISIRQVAHCPVNLVLSGPAGGVGALDYFAAATGFDDLITMEIGGTSCDVMLRAGGRVAVTDRLEVGGYDLVSASVDIHTVGAGGGTIAGADAAGLLFAGPRGAGAVPGPAAYGRGGEEPTVTDAQLVLGRLAPGPYAGGAVSLDLERAETALRTRVGEPLGLGLHDAAIGVIRLVEQNLLQAVERISTERGRDPARFVLVAGGGAGPMHGAAVGRRLGARGVLVPRLAGVFCALGMLNADVGQDFARVFIAPLDEDTAAEAGDSLRGARKRCAGVAWRGRVRDRRDAFRARGRSPLRGAAVGRAGGEGCGADAGEGTGSGAGAGTDAGAGECVGAARRLRARARPPLRPRPARQHRGVDQAPRDRHRHASGAGAGADRAGRDGAGAGVDPRGLRVRPAWRAAGLRADSRVPRRRPPARPPALRPVAGGGADRDGGGRTAGPARGAGFRRSVHSFR